MERFREIGYSATSTETDKQAAISPQCNNERIRDPTVNDVINISDLTTDISDSPPEKRQNIFDVEQVAFISKGFTNWKDATVAFNKHLKSECHKEAVEICELPKKTGDIGEKLSTEHKREKELNREMFWRILQNIRYLTRQAYH